MTAPPIPPHSAPHCTPPAALPYWRLSGYYFFYFAFIGAFSPYFTLYFDHLGLTARDIAILMATMQLMRIIAPTLWGWLADRSGTRVGIVRFSALASLAGYALFFFTTRFEGLFLAILLMSFFWSAALPLVEALTFNHLGMQHSGRYGNIRVWGSVGFIVAVLGLGYLLDYLAVDAVVWMTALILAGIAAIAFTLPECATPPSNASADGLLSILRQPQVQRLFAACFLMSAAHGALYVFYSIHLVAHGYDKATVGWMWAIGVLAEIGVFMLMPRVLRRYGLGTVLRWAFAAAVLRFLLIGWMADSFAVLLFAQLLHGLTFGAYHAAAIASVNDWFPGRLQARGQALYGSLSFGAGGMLGALLSGYTWEPLGAAWTYTLAAGFALAGLILMARKLAPALAPEAQ